MDGKLFLYSSLTPPRISYPTAFVFDLQRFATWTLTQDSTNLKLTNGTIEYTGTAAEIIDKAFKGTDAKDSSGNSITSPTADQKLAANDTIQLGDDISGANGALVFNSGIALTLDLSGYSITNTKTVEDNTLAQKSDNSAIVIGDQIRKDTGGRKEDYDKTEKGNHLTIVNSDTTKEGSITGAFNGVYIFGPQAKLTDAEINDSEHAQYSKLIVGTSEVTGEVHIKGNTGRGISGNGSPGTYADITINSGTIEGTKAGIYNSQVGKCVINGGIIKGSDDTNGSGIEIRSGELEVNGGTIKSGSNSNSGLSYHASAWGNTTNGAGIAVAQHTTLKNITVNINNGDISGYVALSVTNADSAKPFGTKLAKKDGTLLTEKDFEGETSGSNKIVGTITVNVNGGKLESTSDATTNVANGSETTTDDSGATAKLINLTGKNAIFNGDSRVKISVENTVIKGALAGILTGRTDDAYELKEGNTYSNFTGNSTDLFPYYYATKTDGTVIDAAILGTEGWNTTAIENNWAYVVAPTGTESVGTALTQVVADSVSGAFSLTSGVNKTASIVSFDANNNLFKDLTYTSGDETKYYTVIDAGSANDLTSFNITGNERITSIAGGAGNDSLKPAGDVPTVTLTGGAGADVFFFDGNKNTITDFGKGNDSVTLANSKFRPANADFLATTDKITIDFGGGDALMFEGLGTNEVSLPGGHIFATRYHAFDKQITFTSVKDDAFDATSEAKFANYATIDAASASAISIMGNSQDNRIIGSNKGGSLNGGAGNDRLIVTDRESNAKYQFEHKAAGKDSIEGFDDTRDTLDVDATKITEAKGSGSKLTLTFGKDNSVVLKSDVDIEKVSLSATSSDYLTSSGYFADTSNEFKLFANAKGKIDLTDTPYKDTGIEVIDATEAKKQSVTLTADKNVTTVKLAENNKKDLFVYGGGSVSISGYEAGTDKLNIADVGAVSLFTVDSTGVSINAGGKGIISIQGALKNQEVLIRDGGKNNSYQKFVFHDNGVLYNKAKKPTEADIYSNVTTDDTVQVDDSIKKIFLQTGVSGAKIESGNNKATLDASEADGVTLIGGAKNNKFIASTGADMFVYKGGKDNIQDFDAKDEISFNATDFDLNNAKISASGKSLKFKFTNKNTLTLKSDSKITSASINGGNYSFSKNAVGLNGVVSLTSQFSGTYKLADGVTAVDGSAVKKNLTFKGTDAAESLSGGKKKTTFKGGGGDDIFYGGTGKDVFFYAKTDSGDKTIQNFDFGSNNDKIKIASGTIKTISKSSDAITFSTNGGSLTVTKDADNVLIKANNTYYWFAESADSEHSVSVGDLITADTKVSNAQAVATGYGVIDLGYSTNLVKTNLATKAGSFTFSQGKITNNNTTT